MHVYLLMGSEGCLSLIAQWDTNPRSKARSAQSRNTKSSLEGWLTSIIMLLNTIIL